METKFEIDETVYFYNPNEGRISMGTISAISILIMSNGRIESYGIHPIETNFPLSGFLPDKWVFKNKDEVIDFCCNLMRDIEKL